MLEMWTSLLNVEKSLKLIGDVAKNFLNDDKIPLFLGGEHL